MLKAHGKSKTYKFYNYTSGHIHHCTLRNLEVHHHHFTIFSFVMYLTLWFSSCSMTPSTTIWDVWDKQNASSGSSLLLNLVLTFPTRLVSLVIVSWKQLMVLKREGVISFPWTWTWVVIGFQDTITNKTERVGNVRTRFRRSEEP